jgi:hypothetical protein
MELVIRRFSDFRGQSRLVKCCLGIDVRFHISCVARRNGNIPRSEQNNPWKMPQKNGHGDFYLSNGVLSFSVCDFAAAVLLMRAKTLFAKAI